MSARGTKIRRATDWSYNSCNAGSHWRGDDFGDENRKQLSSPALLTLVCTGIKE
jgi:hypothetical protein